MSEVPYDHTITEMLQTASELVMLKPASERVPWVVFLLQEMGTMFKPPEYDQFLSDLQEAITARRQSGSW